ncbi:MAG: hypothetical protein Q8T13_23835 [Acidobacteriota bacterium]|nr:hypothetical protein [Acidobacteriota bacterium]
MNAVRAVTLDTIAGGAVVELFGAELKRVVENIADINTDPEQKRTITISIEFKPEGVKRDNADVKVKCTSKLAGILTVNTQVFMGMHAGKLIAVENDPRQGGLFDEPEVKPLAAVTNISQGRQE